MDALMDGWMDSCIHASMDEWMDRWICTYLEKEGGR